MAVFEPRGTRRCGPGLTIWACCGRPRGRAPEYCYRRRRAQRADHTPRFAKNYRRTAHPYSCRSSNLQNIAKHVVEAELVRRETSNRRRECEPIAALSIHAALVRMQLTEFQISMIDIAAELRRTIAAVTRRRRSRARRVFPLSLRR